jgi:C_GCAxxG_C_C family probable redox protein
MPEALIASASGFPIGVGRSQCMCGAISGAIIALGYFFGRDEQGGENDKCMALSYELQESFRDNHQGTLCCHIHIKGMDLGSGEHKKQCVAFTGEMARKTAELIARELKLKVHYDDVEVR